MDDLFDLFFTMIAGIFILLFAYVILMGGATGAQELGGAKIGEINARETFFLLLDTEVMKGETFLDLLGKVSVEERSEDFKKTVARVMGNAYAGEKDEWWVRLYEEKEFVTRGEEWEGKYKEYVYGKGDCIAADATSFTEIFFIPQADGSKAKLVYCVSPSKLRARMY